MKEYCIKWLGELIIVTKAQFDEFTGLKYEQQQKDFMEGLLRCRKMQERKSQSSEPQVQSTVEATLAQRGSRYGDFTDHARVCQGFKEQAIDAMPKESGRGFSNLSDVQKQAIEVIFDKIARILTGDPNYDDNWHDIQGYAKLVEDRLPKKGEDK